MKYPMISVDSSHIPDRFPMAYHSDFPGKFRSLIPWNPIAFQRGHVITTDSRFLSAVQFKRQQSFNISHYIYIYLYLYIYIYNDLIPMIIEYYSYTTGVIVVL